MRESLGGQQKCPPLTVYKTSFPVLFGFPTDLLGAERSTSGVNFAARMVMTKGREKKPSCVEVRNT